MVDTLRIRMKNKNVSNFGMKVEHTLYLMLRKISTKFLVFFYD